MSFEIKHRRTGNVLFSGDYTSFRQCVLTGIKAGADLMRGAVIPVIPQIDVAILAAVESGGTLDMGNWHTCNTTHCRAGWAVHLAGDAGYTLESKIGTAAAGALIYAASRPGQRVPDFYASDDDALADLKACATNVKRSKANK